MTSSVMWSLRGRFRRGPDPTSAGPASAPVVGSDAGGPGGGGSADKWCGRGVDDGGWCPPIGMKVAGVDEHGCCGHIVSTAVGAE